MYDNSEIKTTYVSGTRDSSITLVLALGLLAVFAGIVGAITGAAIGLVFNSAHVWKLAVAGLALGLLLAFGFAFMRLFYFIEVWLKIDLNGDGYQGNPGDYPAQEPQTEFLTPVWVEKDPRVEGAGTRLAAELPTPKDDTLARMAVILAQHGPEFFTQDNFTTNKQGTKLMTRQHWDERFLPPMIRARLARYKNGENTRQGVELTDQGWNMFIKLAGRAGEQIPARITQEPLTEFAAETHPHPAGRGVDHSSARKTWQ